MNILQLLASSSFITLNKNVIKAVGLEEALLLGELCSEYDYWIKREELQDGYFFSTVENIEENTTLNDYKQRKALKSLQQLKIVDVKVKGLPAKRYFKINEEQLIKLLNIQYSNNLKYSSQNFKELDTKNFECNKNKQNKNKDNNKSINNINNVVNDIYTPQIKQVIDYLNEKTNKNFRATTKKTQTLIKTLLKNKYTVEDIKKVIDIKVKQWGKDNKMKIYLRPETLFGSKFEAYLNEEPNEEIYKIKIYHEDLEKYNDVEIDF